MSTRCEFVLFVMLTVAIVVVSGGCGNSSTTETLCCDGRNDKCYRTQKDKTSKTGFKTCFCDSTCSQTKDCCSDYNQACKPVSCVVQFGKWGGCSNPCGFGMQKRKGNVVVKRENGGKECPELIQHKYCYERNGCKVQRTLRKKLAAETGGILPAHLKNHRKSEFYDMSKGIRKNLWRRYHKNNVITREPYCVHFVITRARRLCQKIKHPKHLWANKLKVGQMVCVECTPLAMKKGLERCKGHGVAKHKTRWNAIGVHGCGGKWERMEEMEKPCSCDPKQEPSFIFI